MIHAYLFSLFDSVNYEIHDYILHIKNQLKKIRLKKLF